MIKGQFCPLKFDQKPNAKTIEMAWYYMRTKNQRLGLLEWFDIMRIKNQMLESFEWLEITYFLINIQAFQ